MTRIAFAWVFFIPERQVFMNNLWYVLLLGVVLALDAVTVSITNGIVESKMRLTKVFLIALFYAFFQFLMPVIGYYASGFLESFIKSIPKSSNDTFEAFAGSMRSAVMGSSRCG